MNKKLILLSLFFPIISFLFFLYAKNYALKTSTPIYSPLDQGETPNDSAAKVFPKLPSPTLDSIFSTDHSWVATISAENKIELIATGDVIPARMVNLISSQKNDFTWAWQNTYEILKKADLTIINLEAPILNNCPVTNEGMVFCGDSNHIKGMLLAGVDIANIANNHYGNHDKNGVEESNQILTQNNILISGGERIIYKKIKNKSFAFLGYNEIGYNEEEKGINWIEENKIKNDINLAKQNSDFVIVSYHWGAEYIPQPEQYRVDLAHRTIDWGADLIIGNHPHWIQPVEIYKNKIITYAHGNLIFDQEWSQETKQGVIGKYIFWQDKIIDVEFIPVFIHDYGQVDFADNKTKKEILDNMYHQSLLLSQNLNN